MRNFRTKKGYGIRGRFIIISVENKSYKKAMLDGCKIQCDIKRKSSENSELLRFSFTKKYYSVSVATCSADSDLFFLSFV